MSDVIWTWDSIIKAAGGVIAVGRRLDKARSTVSSWGDRPGGIPSAHWSAIVELAAERGNSAVTLDVLAELAARRTAKDFAEARP